MVSVMRDPAGFAPTELASNVPPEPLRADGLDEARNEATEAIASRGRERGFVTSEDVLDGLPEMQLAPEQIEEFLAHWSRSFGTKGSRSSTSRGRTRRAGSRPTVLAGAAGRSSSRAPPTTPFGCTSRRSAESRS
jgi:sigma-70-like protein